MGKSVLVLLIILLGGPVSFFWGRTLEPVQVIRSQLAAIHHGEYDRAYTYLAVDAQRALPSEEFHALAQQRRAVWQTWDSTFFSRTIQNDIATIGGHLTGRDGKTMEIRYTLVQQDGGWRIQSFRW